MRHLLIFPLVLAGVLSGLALFLMGASAVMGEAAVSVATLDACSLPCWNTITPHETRLAEASEILQASGYTLRGNYRQYRFTVFEPDDPTRDCRVGIGYSGSRVLSVVLSFCPGMALGDLIALLGVPDGLMTSGREVVFRGGQVIVTLPTAACAPRLTPRMAVESVFLNPEQRLPMGRYIPGYWTGQRELTLWRGFMQRSRYNVTNIDSMRCV